MRLAQITGSRKSSQSVTELTSSLSGEDHYRDKLYSIQITNAFSAVLSVARVEEILGDDQTVRGDDQSVGGDDHTPSPKPAN